jgi:hypothetical protein
LVTKPRPPAIARRTDQDTSLISTAVVSVSIKIAAITVGIAAINTVESESVSKATSTAKMPATETTGELMESSSTEAAPANTSAKGACMESPTEAAAMESPTEATAVESSTEAAAMAASASAAPRERFVIGKHQHCSEERSDDNHRLVSHRIFSCFIDERMTL